MQCLTYVVSISLSHNHGKRPFQSTSRAGQRARFHACTSLVPKPITVVIGLGTRLDVRMRTRFKTGNGQQPDSECWEQLFFDHSEFEAMKSLSGGVAARCDEHQFCAKIKVST